MCGFSDFFRLEAHLILRHNSLNHRVNNRLLIAFRNNRRLIRTLLAVLYSLLYSVRRKRKCINIYNFLLWNFRFLWHLFIVASVIALPLVLFNLADQRAYLLFDISHLIKSGRIITSFLRLKGAWFSNFVSNLSHVDRWSVGLLFLDLFFFMEKAKGYCGIVNWSVNVWFATLPLSCISSWDNIWQLLWE